MSVAMFKTNTCIACRRMQGLVDKYDVDVINLSDPQNGGYIEKYNLRAVPTFIKFDNDVEIDRRVGAITEPDFATWITTNREEENVTID